MIHCIGNSHVNTFSKKNSLDMNFKNELFCSHHIGPIIAYNFTVNHLPKVIDYCNNSVDKNNDKIILCVGEVDCRFHLPYQADLQSKSDFDIVNQCVHRFFESYLILKSLGYSCISHGTHPTTTENHSMNSLDRPIYGNVNRRNNICNIWNDSLEQISISNNIPFFSIYKYLVDTDNITKMDYFLDYCHLNGELVKDFILQEISKIY